MEWLLPLVLVVLLGGVGALWWVRRQSGASPVERAAERLDTVIAWPPARTRVLTTQERLAYQVLVRALPDHIVFAQVPLARFLKVPTRHSYSEWLRRLGHQCADFVICDGASEVVAVVNVQAPAEQESDRGRKRRLRMARVLKAAGIPLHVWTHGALPSPEAARETLLPRAEGETPAPSSPPVLAQRVQPSGPTPFDGGEDDWRADETIEVREPTPSTWFDEFNTAPAPLDQNDKSKRR